MPKVSTSTSNFLRAKRATHNGPDLLDHWTPCMETQINVSAAGGDPVDGRRNTWSNGTDTWWNIRFPKNANSEPEFKDYNLDWPLDLYAEAIGCTGWDWSARVSRWFGFDFDSITGHAAGIGVTDEALEKVRSVAVSLPWVEVRKSTGGKGLHLYVCMDDVGVPTNNHTEHAALARAVLGMMASETGFDFARHIDVCGGNMWIWHRKMTRENGGLSLVKAADRRLSEADLPANWRDHVEVVTRRRSKIRVHGVGEDATDQFDRLTSSHKIIPLDEKHKRIIEELTRSGFSTLWLPDHGILQTHTKGLAGLSATLPIRGFFKTLSEGRDPGTPNCFLFPLNDGAWKVYRFTPGINEAETWTQDGDGWTTCDFNRQPDLDSASRAMGGVERPNSGGFVFDTGSRAAAVTEALGAKLNLPERLKERKTTLKYNRDGRLIVEVERNAESDEAMPGWDARKNLWVRVLAAKITEHTRENLTNYDNVVRQLKTPSGEDAGLYWGGKDGVWTRFSLDKIKTLLITDGGKKADSDYILRDVIDDAWTLVNLPFQPEYVGGRRWNYGAAQYRFQPAMLPEDQVPHHPRWDAILEHCGSYLDQYLRTLDWAVDANIRTGARYLLYWIAFCLREPFEPLPYLFLFGDQEAGKSILHEAIGLLMTKGVTPAELALRNSSGHNGELSNAILCTVEEVDLSVTRNTAYERIKNWVTSRTISIRKMRTDCYTQPNTTHWIQCANEWTACPVFRNDRRITVIQVPGLEPGQEIPKKLLMEELEAEAPHFMRTLMDLELPSFGSNKRLRLPVVESDLKRQVVESNSSEVESFIRERCCEVAGAAIPFRDFYENFLAALADGERYQWTKARFAQAIPACYPQGVFNNNKKCIGNLSWEPCEPSDPLVLFNGRLRRVQE